MSRRCSSLNQGSSYRTGSPGLRLLLFPFRFQRTATAITIDNGLVLSFVLLFASLGAAGAWILPLPGGRKMSFDQGILRIQLENEANLPKIPPLGTPCSVLDCIEVRDTFTSKGWGAFCCNQPIERHTFLGFYEGNRTKYPATSTTVSSKTGQSLDRVAGKSNDDSGKERSRYDYVIALDGGETFLDGYERAQNRKSFSPVHLNHADKSSVECNCLRLLTPDCQNVAFFTARTVEVGEELCFDYGPNYWTRERENEKI